MKKKAKSISLIRKDPGEHGGHRVTIPNTMKALQEAVGGRIETVTVSSDMVIICNEEGRCIGTDEEGNMISLPHNCIVCNVEFVGPILVAGIEGEEFSDCTITLDEWNRFHSWEGTE